MITVQSFTEAIDFKITGGSNYGWNCFGPDARWLDSDDLGNYSASIVFGGPEHTVYLAEVSDLINNRSYRWVNPDHALALQQEADARGVDNFQAWDDVKIIDLETAEDFLEKCTAIVAGNLDYDTRISIPLTLDDAEMLRLMTMAHEHDMTFNSFVEKLLREVIDRELLIQTA
jgi:hypothetical protein